LSGKFYPSPLTDPIDGIRVDSGTEAVTDTKPLPSHVEYAHRNIDTLDNQQYRDCCDKISALPYDKVRHELQKQGQRPVFLQDWYGRGEHTWEGVRPNRAVGGRFNPAVHAGVIGAYPGERSLRSLEDELRFIPAYINRNGWSSVLPPTQDAIKGPELAASNGNNQADETPTTFPLDAGEVAATGTANETGMSYLATALSSASHHPTVQGGASADNYDGEGGGRGETR